jgi:hypothetical protein
MRELRASLDKPRVRRVRRSGSIDNQPIDTTPDPEDAQNLLAELHADGVRTCRFSFFSFFRFS